jgi:hypothetical protein
MSASQRRNWRCRGRILGDLSEAEEVTARSTVGRGEAGALVEARDRSRRTQIHRHGGRTVPVGRLGSRNRRTAASTCAMALFF